MNVVVDVSRPSERDFLDVEALPTQKNKTSLKIGGGGLFTVTKRACDDETDVYNQ